MSVVRVEIAGIDRVREALAEFGQAVEAGVTQAIEASAVEAMTDVRKQIQGPPKTGREYKRGKKMHRASAPGEAPATDTGRLVSSIYYTKVDALTAAIGSPLAYAFFLEFGTLKMPKRPSWIPAAERVGPRLQKRVERVIAQAKAKTGGGTT